VPYHRAGEANAMPRFWVSCVIALTPSFSSFAQQKLHQLLVHGDNFLFSVEEPDGWRGDIAGAETFQSNVVLHATGRFLLLNYEHISKRP
jgi:hypothetical protein